MLNAMNYVGIANILEKKNLLLMAKSKYIIKKLMRLMVL